MSIAASGKAAHKQKGREKKKKRILCLWAHLADVDASVAVAGLVAGAEVRDGGDGVQAGIFRERKRHNLKKHGGSGHCESR